MIQIAILLYEGFTALDAVGPYEVLASLPNAEVTFIAEQAGEIRSDTNRLGLIADATLSDLTHPNVIVVPGGPSMMQAAQSQVLLDWLREAHTTSLWTCSVCTGSFILGMAGLLEGKTVTTHWASRDYTQQFGGAKYVAKRFVQDGKIITAAGVSAGIDMALFIAAQLAGEKTAESIQLALEYDPQPPFQQGDFSRARSEIIKASTQLLTERPHKKF